LCSEIGERVQKEAFLGVSGDFGGKVRKMGKMKGQDKVCRWNSVDCQNAENMRGNSAISSVSY
jgi:hypothetical protein